MIMRVIISAGGTGGHIYPALAIINKIKEREPNSEFLYIGTHDRMEKDIIPSKGIPFKSIEIYGFYRKKMYRNVKTIKYFYKGYKECKKIISEFKPDVVIGVGGYVTGPVIYAAHRLGYPTFIHEQNSIPGRCNKFLSRYVDLIGISFESSRELFKSGKVLYTGNPCSEEAIKKDAIPKSKFGLSEHKKLVLIVMGSLGASKVNEFFKNSIKLFNNKDYEVLYVTGNNSYESFSKIKVPSNVKVVPYIEDLTRIMKKADIMVSRAGASTLSEIEALCVPSILIPSPYVPDNHQYKNAMDLVNKKCAIIVEEKNLKGDILIRKIDELIKNDKELAEMKKNLNDSGIKNSATFIYENLKKLIDRK